MEGVESPPSDASQNTDRRSHLQTPNQNARVRRLFRRWASRNRGGSLVSVFRIDQECVSKVSALGVDAGFVLDR